MRYLKKTIHQDDINRILRDYADKSGVDFARAVLQDFNVTYTTHNADQVPQGGRYIFASNHPLGGFDGVVMADVLASNWGEPRLLVNDLLLMLKNYEPLFLPINKHGTHSRDAIRIIDEAFKSDYPILDFPFGLVSRKVKGKITDLEWKHTFITLARKYERDVVPVYFDGRNTNRFYRLAQWRKRLGIKANIEMFYLPDELFRQAGEHYDIYFGKPISYKSMDKEKSAREWAAQVKKTVYSLKPEK